MNAQYPLSHQADDELHRSTFSFVSQVGPYGMNNHFRSSSDGTEPHDCMLSSFVDVSFGPFQWVDAAAHSFPSRCSGSSHSPHLGHNHSNNRQHSSWSGETNLSSDASFGPQTGANFIPCHSGSTFLHASYPQSEFTAYGGYDPYLASPLPNGPLPLQNASPFDPIMMHPSRSAPSSCATSPLVQDMSTDYLDVPFRKRGTSREHSPAKSDNDPSDAKRRFPCLIEGCLRRFTSQYTLRVHMEAHKPKPKVTFPCTLGCSERFSRQHDRLRHEVSKHGKICEFLCDDCGRFFSSRKTLGNHKCPVANGTTRWMDS